MLPVSRALKPHATVLLTGDGGDDVFLGYPFQRRFWVAQGLARALPSAVLRAWRAIRPLPAKIPFLRRPRNFLDYAAGGLGAVTRVHDGLPYYQQRAMLGERLAGTELSQRNIALSL